jgi:hypothetical protein
VTYLVRCARQRRGLEAPLVAAGWKHSLVVDTSGRLLACGKGYAVGHGAMQVTHLIPTPVAAMAGLQVRSVVAESEHSLALGWDGLVYSWGLNERGLGHGDKLAKLSPVLVEGLEGVRGIALGYLRACALTQAGDVFRWGKSVSAGTGDALRPTIVEGFGGVRVRACVLEGVPPTPSARTGNSFRGVAAGMGASAMARRGASPRPGESRRCMAFG